MKIRTGFVSNSSSSSFVIFGDTEELKDVIKYQSVKIESEEYKNRIFSELNKNWQECVEYAKNGNTYYLEQMEKKTPISELKDKDMYLTSFICDCSDIYDLVKTSNNAYDYNDGCHGYPYDEDMYICLDEYKEVWIRASNEEIINKVLENYALDNEIEEWAKLKTKSFINPNAMTNDDYEQLDVLDCKMFNTLSKLYHFEKGEYPLEEDIKYLMVNGQFSSELVYQMKPRFEKLKEYIIKEYFEEDED